MQSRIFSVPLLSLTFLFLFSVSTKAQVPPPPPALSQDQQPQILRTAPLAELPPTVGMPGCISNAQSGYSGKKCVVYINRLAPVSPPALIVPKNTTVYVVVFNTRWNEAVTFASALSKTTTPDVAAATLKNFATPLQSLITSVVKLHVLGVDGGEMVETDISKNQRTLTTTLNNLQSRINHANAAMTCLSNYENISDKATDPSTGIPSKYSCTQENLLNPTTFYAARERVISEANAAAVEQVPILLVKRMDAEVDKDNAPCLDLTKSVTPYCSQAVALHMSNRTAIDTAATGIQAAQATLLQSIRILNSWPGTPDNVAYQFNSAKFHNLVLTISGQEIVNKVASPIATVTVNTQANSWVVSAGLAFSNLKFHTYTAAPIIDANGNPVLDGSGKVTTIVTQQSQSPSVIAPLGLVSYRLTELSRAKWENKCANGCSFLLSGGVGANLTSKSADFDIGPSFQLGGFLLTPAIHFGRDTRLSNGVQVGQKLGSSPPSTLPTVNSWVTKWAIALTYTIPIP
jgi:hypothetical protein